MALRHTQAAVTCALLCTAVSSASAAFTQSGYDFGTVSGYAVAAPAPTTSYGQNGIYAANLVYTREFTFSLASDQSTRIDVRAEQRLSKYNGASAYLAGAAFSVFDSAHQLIGTASVDPDYSGPSDPMCPPASAISCIYKLGLTFNGALKAGKYSFEFSGDANGYAFSFPTLRFGVSSTDPAIVASYLKALTPGVPEANSGLMLALGLAGLVVGVNRRKHTA